MSIPDRWSHMTTRALLGAAIALAIPASALAAGAPEASFVPPALQVEKRATADLNGDRVPDVVLGLVGRTADATGYQTSTTEPAPRPRRLLVLAGVKGGGFARLAVGAKVLPCTRCGGAFWGTLEVPVSVRIDRSAGDILVAQQFGSRELTSQILRFDVDARKVVLISARATTTDRLTGVVTTAVYDHRARTKTVTTRAPGKKATVKVTAIGGPVPLARVDYSRIV